MSKRVSISIIGISLLSVFIGVFSLLWFSLGQDPTYNTSPLIGKPLPSLNLPLLNEETNLDLTTLQGKPFLLNIWATWCVTCAVEHGFLNHLAKEGVRIIGLNYKDDLFSAREWLNKYGSPYEKVLVDQHGRGAIALGIFGTPETLLVDEKGIIQYRHIGPVNENVWENYFKSEFK